MKKSTLIFGAMMLLAACAKTPVEEREYPEPQKGQKYVLEGTVTTDGFTWVTASNLGIYGLTDGVVAQNLECRIDGWLPATERDSAWFKPSKYEGQAVGQFMTPEMDLVKGPNKLLVYSPYNKDLSFIKSMGVIYNLEVSDNQVQPKANVAGDCFAYGIAESIPGVDEKFSFSLEPVTAMLKITVNSREFADYGVKKITVFDESGAAAIGGSFDIYINDKKIDPIKTGSKVATTVASPAPMGSNSQSVYMNILPGDFSSTEFTMQIELTGDKGNVIIPIKKKGTLCEIGKTTEITISDLKSSDNIYPWYCPVETRLMSGLGYAYGDANTYLIQCKNGSTYTGATYSPNADIPESVTIDYRLRGDISKGEAPTDVTFEWVDNNGKTYVPRSMSNASDYNASGVKCDATAFEITPNTANFTVTVKNLSAFAGAPILVMKKGDKILWGWSFWNVAADGTKVESVNIGGVQMANMAIGQATTDLEKWIANKSGSNPDPIFRTVHYYQHGRFLPVFWTTYWSNTFIYSAEGQEQITASGNVIAINGPFKTLKESLEHPAGVITHVGGDAMSKWCEEDYADLWGGVMGLSGKEKAGTKSIYDPCPKGWRVPDYQSIEAIAAAMGDPKTATYDETKGHVGYMIGSEWLGYLGYIDYKALASGTSRPTNYGNGNNGAWSNGFSMYWSNYLASKEASSPFCLRFYGSNNKATEIANPGQMIRSSVAPVRCQRDTDNR